MFSSIIYSEKRIGIKHFDKSSQILPTNSFIRARMDLWALSPPLPLTAGGRIHPRTHILIDTAPFLSASPAPVSPRSAFPPVNCRHVFLRQDDSRERAQTKTDIILKNRRIAAFFFDRRRSIFYCGLARNSFIGIFANTKGRIVVYIYFCSYGVGTFVLIYNVILFFYFRMGGGPPT